MNACELLARSHWMALMAAVTTISHWTVVMAAFMTVSH